jgi:hypothetical protein
MRNIIVIVENGKKKEQALNDNMQKTEVFDASEKKASRI